MGGGVVRVGGIVSGMEKTSMPVITRMVTGDYGWDDVIQRWSVMLDLVATLS